MVVILPQEKNALFRKFFLILFAFLILIDYAIPYTILSKTAKISGSFLFWPLLTVAAACLAFLAVSRWEEDR
jgi:hypothetical protein